MMKARIYLPPKPPSVSVGPDQEIFLPSNEVFFKVEVKPDSGKIRDIKWTALSGRDGYKISPSKKNQTRISNLEEGEYAFLVEVTLLIKKESYQLYDTVNVKVSGKDWGPPIVEAGPDVTIFLPTNSVKLLGKAESTNPNGFIRTYLWTQVSGPTEIKIDAPSKPETQVSGLVKGAYQFRLLVTDNNRVSNEDNVTVTVSPRDNKPPLADAGLPERSITLPINSLTLNGRASDPDGSEVFVRWTKIRGPGQPRIVTPTSAVTQITNLSEGIYQFQLTVTDKDSASDTDKVTVFVLPPPFSEVLLPIANAGDNIVITLPINSVTLIGIGTHHDPNGTITNYRWSQISGPSTSTIVNPESPITQVNNLTRGDYEFKLTVTDKNRNTATDDVSVKVLASQDSIINNPPIVKVGSDTTITLPTNSMTLSGSATDPDSNGLIMSYQWTKLSGPSAFLIASSSDSNKTIVIENLAAGEYEFELKATDNKGAVGSGKVKITVEKKENAIIPLIIGIGLGIIGLAGSWYFFIWLPTTKKIMVYFMHKDEEELANLLMPDSIRTEGYSVGDASRNNINKMKKKNFAIHILNPEMLLINTPGKTRTLNYSIKKGERKLKSEIIDARPGVNIKNLVSEEKVETLADEFPAFYIITLDTPLLTEYEAKLIGVGLHIIQHVPYNSYIIYVEKPDQLAALKTGPFNFIRLINKYSPSDTGLMVREDHFLQAVNTDGRLTLDIVLHRAEDKGEVYAFLEELDIQIVGSYRNRIRIIVLARSVLNYNLAGNTYIQAIYEYIPPMLHNDIARQIIGIDTDVQGKVAVTETGLGEIIGVADTGIDLDHPDLKSKIMGVVAWGRKETNNTSDPHGHGTHVTGSIVGDGTASGGKIKGMAPGAKVFFQSLMDDAGTLANFDLKLQELFKEAYDHGARIHNNSWGAAAEARYTIDSTIVDEFIYDYPEMLIVISAGNEGICNSDQQNEKGYVGFGSVGSPATTKNGLTVGASRNKRTTGGYASATYGKIWPDKFKDPPTSNELISGDPDSIAAFSSRGRCDDFRMKPDIVAPGTDILSLKSGLAPLNKFHGGYAGFGDAYAFLSGTSMSAPIVSGAAAIVREYYKNKRKFPAPSAALIKATLINGTRKMKGMSAIHLSDMIPNPNQGYGMLDLSMTIPNEKNMFHLEYRDSLQDASVSVSITGQEYAVRFRTKQITWIRACLSYTDFPVRSIQNNLDLLMDYEPTREKWSGNIGINADDKFVSRKEDST
ncbi:MAG: S8 family serine peptidase, partial [Saprospiraceae bacterium]|nr:S8 family serine peptidase [Saprospiraceae bacterium]